MSRNTVTIAISAVMLFALYDYGAQSVSGQVEESGWVNYPSPAHPPQDAPNILLIMTDDVGFAAASGLGGAIPTPVFDALAENGLLYNAFHTTAMCSPSRAALLTGRNHHSVNYGAIADVATDQEGYTSVIPDTAATIGRVLQLNGYETAFIGKNHNIPMWETGPTGPFDHWPNALGFDYFYGFNGAWSNQFTPDLVEDNRQKDPPFDDPDYILDEDLADHLIDWMTLQHSVKPDQPFFAYWAPGTMHSPHQAPAEWIAQFDGHFDQGWDRLRQETFERQKAMSIIPGDAQLAPKPEGLPDWDDLTTDQQQVSADMMEVAAAQLAFYDHQVGRVVAWLKDTDQFDNTLIIFIQGDNGASLEGGIGTISEWAGLVGVEFDYEDLAAGAELYGGPLSWGNYASPWAWATNTPFPWGKQLASHLGGLRAGLVISWPDRINSHGEIRTQFGHLIDIAPTIYEAIGIDPPEQIDGIPQQPIEGISLVYSFDDSQAPSQHRKQYFEMLGNRSFYNDGWLASTTPAIAPWDRSKPPVDPYSLEWELYNLNEDFSQANDIAREYPEKLADLQSQFDQDAERYNVYPLGSSLMERLKPENRPDPLAGRDEIHFYPGPTRYPENSFPAVRPGWTMTAHVDIDDSAANGPIVINGGFYGGWGLLLDDGVPTFIYNPSGRELERTTLTGNQTLSPGEHEIAVRFSGIINNEIILSLAVDQVEMGNVAIPQVYRTLSYTFVGRYGLEQFLVDQPREMLTDALIQLVAIHLDP